MKITKPKQKPKPIRSLLEKPWMRECKRNKIQRRGKKFGRTRSRIHANEENVESLKPNWYNANKHGCLRKCEFINDDDDDHVKKSAAPSCTWTLANERVDFQAIWMLKNTMYYSSGQSTEEGDEKKRKWLTAEKCGVTLKPLVSTLLID